METSLSRATLSSQNVQVWLIAKFAAALEVGPERIQPDVPIVSYGLDSMATIAIADELEQALEMPLPPTLVWDYPTIEALAEHLGSFSKVPANASSSAPAMSSTP